MSRHEDGVRLEHMLDHAREAAAMIVGRSRGDLETDRMFELASMRLLEIIGEAAGRVSDAARASIPEIAWPKIIGMRNRIIHGYDQVDPDLLWDTMVEDLPVLVDQLQAAISRREAR